MKKSFTLISLAFILLSACAKDLQPVPLPEIAREQVTTLSNINLLKNSNQEISIIAENIFLNNFADGVKKNKSNKNSISNIDGILNLIPGIKEKGPAMFRLLNNDPKTQEQFYPFTDEKIGAYLTKPSQPDNTPAITPAEINQLLNVLKPGDLILCGNDDSFIHSILYLGNNLIIHSLASKGKGNNKFLGVIREPLTEYIARSERDKFVVLRYRNLHAADFQKAAGYASQQIGKSYDTLFLMYSDTRFYCTELVYQALMHMDNPPQVYPQKTPFGWELIRNEDFMDSPDFDTVWALHYTRPAVGRLYTYK